MQAFSHAQSNVAKTKQVMAEAVWLPSLTPPAPTAHLEAAMHALNEAESVIRSQAEQIRHLESMAMTDELTGLLNRRGFLMSLHRELSLSRRDPAADGVVIMVDLDGFKTINDLWGHGTGDDYLQAVAHTLLGSVRASDMVGRLGGDEFAILFPHMTEAVGMKRLYKLEQNFNSRIVQFGDKTLPLRASFGLAPYTGTDSTENVLANADLKLYAHKARRKGIEAAVAF